jgi:hypothetical protein
MFLENKLVMKERTEFNTYPLSYFPQWGKGADGFRLNQAISKLAASPMGEVPIAIGREGG